MTTEICWDKKKKTFILLFSKLCLQDAALNNIRTVFIVLIVLQKAGREDKRSHLHQRSC